MTIFMPPINFSLTGRAFYLKPSLQRKQKNRFGALFSVRSQLPGEYWSATSGEGDLSSAMSRFLFDPLIAFRLRT
jgi:hypothetical protein